MDYLIGGGIGVVAGLVLGYFYAKKIAAAAVAEYQKIQKAL